MLGSQSGSLIDALLAVDAPNNRTFAVYQEPQNGGSVGTLQSFDRTHFNALWIARLPIGARPVRWGVDGLAFLGPDPGQPAWPATTLYRINGPFVTGGGSPVQ